MTIDRFGGLDLLKFGRRQVPEVGAAARTIPSVFYWLSGSPPAGTGWNPSIPARNMLWPSPVAVPSWADRDYVAHTIRTFRKTGFHGGLNYYRAFQTTFDLTPAFKGAVIRQPTLYIYGAADGLSVAFRPTPPTPSELRRFQPGLIDVIRLENVGPWVQHEAADRVNVELIKFLRTIGSTQEASESTSEPGAARVGG